MPILDWTKPDRVQTKENWANSNGFDSGPIGGYVPNMSKEDQNRWKPTLKGVKSPNPWIEIRKTVKGCQMLMIVSLGGGYTYKYHRPEQTLGTNVQISANGQVMFSFDEMQEMQSVVEEAKEFLQNLHKQMEADRHKKENPDLKKKTRVIEDNNEVESFEVRDFTP